MDKLQLSNLKTPLFSLQKYITEAKCVKCYDADSVHLVFLFNDKYYRWKCRLINIDAAELRSDNIVEKNHALQAKQYLSNLILHKIVKITCYHFDKYGRLLIEIEHDGKNINQELIKKGFAYQYFGGKRKLFSDWYKL